MLPNKDFTYCMTRYMYETQCKTCKRNHTLYDWSKLLSGLDVYWAQVKADPEKSCEMFRELAP